MSEIKSIICHLQSIKFRGVLGLAMNSCNSVSQMKLFNEAYMHGKVSLCVWRSGTGLRSRDAKVRSGLKCAARHQGSAASVASLPSSSSSSYIASWSSSLKYNGFRNRKLQTISSTRRVIVHAAWGADVVFKPAKILETTKIGDNLHRIILDIGADVAAEYTIPGQFIQAKVEESAKPGFFAIASPPDVNNAGAVELLIKEQPGSTAEALCKASQGDEILVSAPMGKGFRVDSIPPETYKTVYLFATGSGISPIKAVIESGKLDCSKRSSVTLYYGARNPGVMAYSDLFDVWKNEYGIKIIPVYSEEGKGYVQDVFVKNGGISSNGSDVAALLCGHKGMAEAITEVMTAAGVPKESILLNF